MDLWLYLQGESHSMDMCVHFMVDRWEYIFRAVTKVDLITCRIGILEDWFRFRKNSVRL